MILDTNALSAWWDNAPDIISVLDRAAFICVPVPAIAEFRYGVLQSRLKKEMARWMDQALASTTILTVDLDTTGHYAELRLALKKIGRPIPMNDLWIAAIARQHRLPILSRDVPFDQVEGVHRIAF